MSLSTATDAYPVARAGAAPDVRVASRRPTAAPTRIAVGRARRAVRRRPPDRYRALLPRRQRAPRSSCTASSTTSSTTATSATPLRCSRSIPTARTPSASLGPDVAGGEQLAAPSSPAARSTQRAPARRRLVPRWEHRVARRRPEARRARRRRRPCRVLPRCGDTPPGVHDCLSAASARCDAKVAGRTADPEVVDAAAPSGGAPYRDA